MLQNCSKLVIVPFYIRLKNMELLNMNNEEKQENWNDGRNDGKKRKAEMMKYWNKGTNTE